MKIALLVQRFPHGGAESYVEEIAKRLHAQGEDVTVITSQNGDDKKYGFRIIRLASRFSLGEYSWWMGLEDVLKKERFDLVHTNTYGYFHSDKAASLKKKLGYKLVMTSHGFTGMDIHNLKKTGVIKKSSRFDFIRPFYDNYIGQKTLKRCDHLIALSQKDVDLYTEVGIEKSKITIIPPGIRDEFFVHDEKIKDFKSKLGADPILLSVGELSFIKNQILLVKAMPQILEIKPDTKLFFIGRDGGELENLRKLCSNLHLDGKIVFLDVKNSDEVSKYMRSADLLIHVSLAEGLSTVLLESMACGLPFMTTPAGGNGYLVQESKAGMGTPFEDEKELAKNIIGLIENKAKLQQMALDGISYAADLHWAKTFEKIMQLYQNLVGNEK